MLRNDGNNVYSPAEEESIVNIKNIKAKNPQGILDMIYGVLFDPVPTLAGFAGDPPLRSAAVIFIALQLAEALMGFFTAPQYLGDFHWPGWPARELVNAAWPVLAAGGFLFAVAKWLVAAGLLHLLAELCGGRGSARGVLAVCGVAGLPAVFMLPVQLGVSYFNPGPPAALFTALLGLGLFIWSTVLLVVGIREVHGLSTGRAVLVVLTPGLAVLLLVVLITAAAYSFAVRLPGVLFY